MLQRRKQRLAIRLVEKREFPVFQGLGYFFQQVVCGLFPKRLFENRAGVLQAAFRYSLVGQAHLVVLIQDVFCSGGIYIAQLRNLQGDLFHIIGIHVLIELGCLLRAKRDHDGCCLLLSRQLFCSLRSGCPSGSCLAHSPSPSRSQLLTI